MYVCMYVCMYAFFCVVLSFVARGLAMRRSPVRVALSNCLKLSIISKVNSEPENTSNVMEGSRKYIEKVVADRRQGMVLQRVGRRG
jgi:hypothetical protein